jgi:hypothetical protein
MAKKIPILYDFNPYRYPRKGLFSVSKSHYTAQEVSIIIGETDDTYVTRLKESKQGYWEGDKVVQERFVLPIGIHKTRLIQWTEGQLQLY